MQERSWLADFIITFVVTFIVTLLVTLLWSLIAHGAPEIDWETSFRFAIIFGIVVPLTGRWGRGKGE